MLVQAIQWIPLAAGTLWRCPLLKLHLDGVYTIQQHLLIPSEGSWSRLMLSMPLCTGVKQPLCSYRDSTCTSGTSSCTSRACAWSLLLCIFVMQSSLLLGGSLFEQCLGTGPPDMQPSDH